MNFCVLGPIEASTPEGHAVLGPPKQRALLAALLLAQGATVPVRQLIDTLWPTRPPRSAVKNLQLYVSHLRAAVGVPVRSNGSGYRLDPATSFDLTTFEQLLADAREHRRSGELTLAVAQYRRALELWRGPALSDLVERELLLDDAAYLNELRLRALDECLEVELTLERHRQLVPELQRLVAQHPLHESLRRHQVRALHGAGRHAEAAAAYLDACRMLERELVAEPGPQLRELARSLGLDTHPVCIHCGRTAR